MKNFIYILLISSCLQASTERTLFNTSKEAVTVEFTQLTNIHHAPNWLDAFGVTSRCSIEMKSIGKPTIIQQGAAIDIPEGTTEITVSILSWKTSYAINSTDSYLIKQHEGLSVTNTRTNQIIPSVLAHLARK